MRVLYVIKLLTYSITYSIYIVHTMKNLFSNMSSAHAKLFNEFDDLLSFQVQNNNDKVLIYIFIYFIFIYFYF